MEGLAQASQLSVMSERIAPDELRGIIEEHIQTLPQTGPYRSMELVAATLGCSKEVKKDLVVVEPGLASALFVTALCGRFFGSGHTPPDDLLAPWARLARLLEALGPRPGRFGMSDEESWSLVDGAAKRLWGRTALDEIQEDIEGMENAAGSLAGVEGGDGIRARWMTAPFRFCLACGVKVRALTFYGSDNPIDLLVRKNLLEKHKKIFTALGIYVPVPHESDRMVETLIEEIFFRERSKEQLEMEFDYDLEPPQLKELDIEWDKAVEREKKSRALFAQHAIKVGDVTQEVQAARRALGGEADVHRFVIGAVQTMGVTVHEEGATTRIPLDGWARFLDEVVAAKELRAVFKEPAPEGTELLTRTHPVVQSLGARVLESALDPTLAGPGRRCGVVRTHDVTRRTTLLLLRMRFHIVVRDPHGAERALLAEDATLAGFSGSPEEPSWMDEAELEKLVFAVPSCGDEKLVRHDHAALE
jgi:hypothetical protein